MDIIDDLVHLGEERALRISKLLQLISMHQNSIEQHQKAGSPDLIIQQYQELLTERIDELQQIMQEIGIQVRLNSLNNAA